MAKHTKGSEIIQYFPSITQRLKIQIPVTSKFTTLLTRHGKVKKKKHDDIFYITEDSICTCEGGSHTAHHLLYDCKEYKERMQLRNNVMKNGDDPYTKINFHQIFLNLMSCINSI